jgi:glutathione S-transferase
MTLFGGPISPFVRKVGMALIVKGLDSQVKCVRARTAMLQANVTLMEFNPLSKIPVLLGLDGDPLYDSDVICEYLDAEFPDGPRLLPPSGAPRYQALCWTALASGMLETMVLWRFERNRSVAQQSQPLLATYEQKIRCCLDRVEALMPKIASAPMVLPQITLGCVFGYFDFRFAEFDWRTGHADSTRWYELFLQREAAQRTEPYEDDRFEAGVTCGGHEPFWPRLTSP